MFRWIGLLFSFYLLFPIHAQEVQMGKLIIETKPPAAQVLIQGKPVGITPLTLELPGQEKVCLDLALKGFKAYHTEVQVHPGHTIKIFRNFEKDTAEIIDPFEPPKDQGKPHRE